MIESTTIKDDYVEVEALVGDAGLIRHATHWDPPEYAPALCRAGFYLDEGEQVPSDEDGFCRYLDQLDLDWELIPVDNTDCFID